MDPLIMTSPGLAPHILVVGGGYVGMYTALRLQKRLRKGEARVTVVDPRSYMTYQPFLPEAAAGALEARHVVVPLRRVLRECEVLTGRVTSIRHAERRVVVQPRAGDAYEIPYDHLVVALGSVARTLPIPGLIDHGIGFKHVEEAISLRNHVLDRLDVAATTADEKTSRRALTFTFIGGGYAGVEAFAELEDMARYAATYTRHIHPDDMRWILVEASNRILPEVGPDMGVYTLEQLRRRGMDVRLNTRLESCVGGHVVLSDGDEFDSDTIVWTAGVKPNPVLRMTDLPLDERGRVKCTADLRIEGLEGAWAAGDNAAVPDLSSETPGATCGPSAQHAVRQSLRLGDNLVAAMRGEPTQAYVHKYAGSVASLGLYKGVAQIYGRKMKGFPAWFMHRSYHMSRMPTFARKVHVIMDWTGALLFRREIVGLGSIESPPDEFIRAASLVPEPSMPK